MRSTAHQLSQEGIAIYAELLPHIRQVSVAATLPSAADSSTTVKITENGHFLLLSHQGKTSRLRLPASVNDIVAVPAPKPGSLDLTWRLPLARSQTQGSPSTLRNRELPWSALDIKNGSSVSCRCCGHVLVRKDCIEAWTDLPSEGWAEMMEFWHCHKPHDHEHKIDEEAVAKKGYAAGNRITYSSGTGFVGLSSFNFAETDCRGLVFSNTSFEASQDNASQEENSHRPIRAFCEQCKAEVGLLKPHAASVTLFKWQITCETKKPHQAPSSLDCLASVVMAAISRSGSAKSVIVPSKIHDSRSTEHEPEALYLWVLNTDVKYSSSAIDSTRAAMKVLYRVIGTEEANKMVESINSDVQDLDFPGIAIDTAIERLKESNLLLPSRDRALKEWEQAPFSTSIECRGGAPIGRSSRLSAGNWYPTPRTMSIREAQYVPAGCLGLHKADGHLGDEFWSLEDLRAWHSLRNYDHDVFPDTTAHTSSSHRNLQPSLQSALLKEPALRHCSSLLKALWARLEVRIHGTDDRLAIVRVYLLPDDIHRRAVDRSDSKLQRARKHVVQALDYSSEAWNGTCSSLTPGNYLLHGPQEATNDDETSLLELFNSIPSPNPDCDLVKDPYHNDAMYDILEGTVPGLLSTLHPYQKRSAALMLQKEAQPGKTLDPRLLGVRGLTGCPWYLDPATGSVLLEPRYYDGVAGGILAEEMGAGKTIICLAVILASRCLPSRPPAVYHADDAPTRPRVVSLTDMAASAATRKGLPWRLWIDSLHKQGMEADKFIKIFERNTGYYEVPAPKPYHGGRHATRHVPPPAPSKKVYLSAASIIVVPNNLIAQWRQEIEKHTTGLKVLVFTKNNDIPAAEGLQGYDIILFAQSRFETIANQPGGVGDTPLGQIHFQRCIIDEGHKLGNSRIGSKSNLLLGLDALHISARWIVTGTPSRGLFGVDGSKLNESSTDFSNEEKNMNDTSLAIEKDDLKRIGAIAALYLKARPWANTTMETGDTTADWTTYLMLPKHNPKSHGRWDCLRSTLNSLIIRHQLTEVGDLLPPVDEKVVLLDGSYQDVLSQNIFSMMIIFNSVQSQRTDKDYFFHHSQRKSLLQVVQNLKQSSFFGGSFFASEVIATSVKTAETFLEEGKIPITSEDEALLRAAIQLGHLAVQNKLRNLSNQYHEMPLTVTGFPGGAGQSWSLDDSANDVVCTSSTMLLALQKLIYKAVAEPEKMNSLLNGGLIQEGLAERASILSSHNPASNSEASGNRSQTLAGNTKLGEDTPKKARSHGVNRVAPKRNLSADSFSGPLELTEITSTVSAKLSYLIDSIVKYQAEEKIIVFYENDNVAWYLAGMLDVLQIQHLIYAKGLTAERRAQYVNTFHHKDGFRVLLMDISQAAFGLDMREASRIYFINPVLNPQVEAQAIGRVRRISQQKPVSVETLVLRGSIDEVILERKKHMTQAEHRQAKSLLDVRPIYNWIKNAKIADMPAGQEEMQSQMAPLKARQKVFGRGFGRTLDPDDGLLLEELSLKNGQTANIKATATLNGIKRAHDAGPGAGEDSSNQEMVTDSLKHVANHPARRVRFTAGPGED
ncbi:hypothetical protein S40288_01384 [Stachybotrys chartarum IBT 40288]|nr:hypothetical protein S40288_01384 [Stachybotrys chartarum IBT 40288]